MELNIEESVILKPELQPEKALTIDSESTGNNLLSKTNEKNADSMELEEETSIQLNQSTDLSGVTFWQTQQLPAYKEVMKKLIIEGLPIYEVNPLSEERVKELLAKIDEDIRSENNKQILIKLISQKIDGSRDPQREIAKRCKEYIDSLTNVFAALDENYYMSLIISCANLKSYLEIKIQYLEDLVMNLNEYNIWELNKLEMVEEIANRDLVSSVKNQRVWKKKVFNALDKLIRSIQKIKTENDLTKTWNFKNKYEEILNKKPEYVEKPSKATKRKHKNVEDQAPLDDLEHAEAEALNSLKKMKLTSAKPSANKSTPVKISLKKNTPVKNPTFQIENETPTSDKTTEGLDLGTPETLKKGKDTVKKEKEKEKEKDSSQKNIMNFFKKKVIHSEKKIEATTTVVPSKFKSLGSLHAKTQWDSSREELFESIFNKQKPQPDIIELINLAKNYKSQLNKRQEVRKIFINIHDSCKRIKGRFDGFSTTIRGRNPLAKDEALINYEIDSEEEMQEQNAENIDEDNLSENESEIDEEDEEDFIVPDGYVSPQERDPENSDGEENEKKIGFIHNFKFKDDLDFKNKPKPFYFSMINDYEAGKDAQLDDYLSNFKIVKLIDEDFPIKPKRGKENIQTTGKTKLNPEAINDDEIIRELLLSIHGEFAKPDTVKKINAKFPTCSKKTIERKITELEASEQIKKEKLPGETKSRYVVQKEFFLKFGSEDEYNKLLTEKLEKELEKQKIEKEKRETEKKAKKEQSQLLESKDLKKDTQEIFEDETKEVSNGSFPGGRNSVQTKLNFNIFKNNKTNTNSNRSFSDCQVEISEMESSISNAIGRDKIEEEIPEQKSFHT